MKIGLVVVLGGDLVRSTEHLGISYIASYLRDYGYTVDIIEIKGLKDEKNLEKLLQQGSYGIVAFTTTCVNMDSILSIAKIVKESNKNIQVVLGGHMATFWGERILKEYKFIDAAISKVLCPHSGAILS